MAPSPNALATACLAALFLTATPLSSAFTTRSTISNRNINLARSSSRSATDVPKMTATEGPGGHETPERENDADSRHTAVAVSRGGFFASIATAALGTSAAALGLVLASPESASANGMLDFPPARLNNRYFLMRSGQGASDKEGVVQSHPIDKLHVDNRLTDQGVEETQRAAGVLRALGVSDAFIWADISSRAQDTARILAQELDIRQERVIPEYAFLEPRGMGIFDGKEVATVLPEERVVPEYAFLEPRGMGIFDGKEVATVLPEVYEKDAISLTWRPPPNTDGTPNESVDDVFVRVRQLLSKLETQYQGEDVIIVAPDSDCLSVLQSFVLGEDMGKHSKYYLRPGEGRQLRVSLDTEVGYSVRREAKAGSTISAGIGGGGVVGEGA